MGLSIKLFWKVFSALLFVVVSGGVLFFAYGYRYDFEDQEIQKTSIIDFQGKFADVAVKVDGTQVVSSMPYQFKGILPGVHELEIQKDGFHPWKRSVKVVEDRVSIVEDVLLVPELLEDYESEVFVIEEDEDVFFGDGYLLVMKSGEKVMKAVVFGEEGKVSIEDIQLFKPVMKVVSVLPQQKFLLQFDDNQYSFVDLAKQRFNLFYLPEEAYGPKVDIYEGRVFFMIDSSLYRMSFSELVSGEFEGVELTIVNEGVGDYAVDYYGGIYYVVEGQLFYSNGSGEPALIKLEGFVDSDEIKNIAIREAGQNRTLIVRTVSDRRFLYAIDRSSVITKLSGELAGIPYYANSDMIVYSMEDGGVFTYDFGKQRKSLVFQNRENSNEILGWYANQDYLLVTNEQRDIFVIDLFNRNRFILKEKFDGEFLQSKAYSLYFYNEGVLQVQYFEEEMRIAKNNG